MFSKLLTTNRPYGFTAHSAQGYLARKKFARKIFKFFYQTLFIIKMFFFQVWISTPLQAYKLMVPIAKKPAPGDLESSLKLFFAKLFLARCPCFWVYKFISLFHNANHLKISITLYLIVCLIFDIFEGVPNLT